MEWVRCGGGGCACEVPALGAGAGATEKKLESALSDASIVALIRCGGE